MAVLFKNILMVFCCVFMLFMHAGQVLSFGITAQGILSVSHLIITKKKRKEERKKDPKEKLTMRIQ